MRIISGTQKGRTIQPPKNLRARPTTDFAKENLFNMLNSHWDLEGIEVLDLFSGTGSISYEFASRGAGSIVSVEINAVHHRFIKDTAQISDLRTYIRSRQMLFISEKLFQTVRHHLCRPSLRHCRQRNNPRYRIRTRSVEARGLADPRTLQNLNLSSEPHFVECRSYGSVHFSIFCKR